MWSAWQTWKIGRRAAGFLAGLLVALLLAAGPAAGATFSDPMTLSNGGVANTPAVAVTASGRVYVAWREGDDIWFTRSVPSRGSCTGPGRLEFAPARNLSEVNAAQVSASVPSIAANDGGGVYVVWQEVPLGGTIGGVQAIRFRGSADGGVNFGSAQSLDFNRFAPVFPAVAADNSGVYVAWQDSVAGKTSVLMAQSLNGGAFTYGNVTANRPSSRRPSLASDGSKVHVLWRETAVWYKAFTPGSDLGTVGSAPAIQLTGASVPLPPKIAVHGSQVTAAWFEGTSLKARTMTDGLTFGAAETIYTSTMSLSSLSLSFGGAGRFFAWQEADFSIHYLLGTAAGTLRSSSSATNPAAPSVGQDGTDRLVATWQENGTTGTEIRLAHTGGSTGGGTMLARVWAEPRVLNYRTVGRGTGQQPNFTVFIEPTAGMSASEIDPGSVKLKVEGKDGEYSALLGPSALGDHDGNGTMDLMVKFNRSIFDGAGTAVAAQSTGNYTVSYTVTGKTYPPSNGCFKSGDAVQIMR